MANYAGYCTACNKVVFTPWGNKKCPVCGKKTIIQGRTDESSYKKMNELDQIALFIDYYPENSPERLKVKRDEEARKEAMLEKAARAEQLRQERIELIRRSRDVVVTTADLHEDYDIVGPVFFQVNDAGAGGNFRKLIAQYQSELEEWEAAGQRSNDELSTVELIGEFANLAAVLTGADMDRDILGNSHANFDQAFLLRCRNLK